MLDKQQARVIALAFIKELEAQKPERPLAIMDDKIIEKPFAWIFPITTKAHLLSGNIGDQVPGLGPIVVDRETRKAHSAPSSVRLETYLKYYESTRAKKE